MIYTEHNIEFNLHKLVKDLNKNQHPATIHWYILCYFYHNYLCASKCIYIWTNYIYFNLSDTCIIKYIISIISITSLIYRNILALLCPITWNTFYHLSIIYWSKKLLGWNKVDMTWQNMISRNLKIKLVLIKADQWKGSTKLYKFKKIETVIKCQ